MRIWSPVWSWFLVGGAVRASDVETVFEAQDRLHVVYPKGHRTGRLKSVTHLALTEFPLILMQRDTSVRAIVGAGFHAAGLMPEATCEAIYMMTAVGMVRWAIMREERHEDSVHQR
jgi:hypothetical protein